MPVIFRLATLILLTFSFSGCRGLDSARYDSDPSLLGRKWDFDRVVMNDRTLASSAKQTDLTFSDREACDGRPDCEPSGGLLLSGQAPCNSYSGAYRADAVTGEIDVVNLITTEMACTGEGIMETERAFYDVLSNADRYAIEGAELRIESEAGAIYFRADPADAAR